MNSPVFHPASKRLLDAMRRKLPQTILLAGPHGVGLTGAIEYLSKDTSLQIITILPEKDEKVDLKKGKIGVELIRKLQEQVRSKSNHPRLIVIDYAERITTQAQNAFLKLLEEPNHNVYFLLATHAPTNLLPTVRSRSHQLKLRPITDEQSLRLISSLGVSDKQHTAQLIYLAAGLPAELTRLVSDQEYFQAKVGILKDARSLIAASSAYDKLIVVTSYKNDREKALELLDSATIQLRKSLSDKKNTEIAIRLENILRARQSIEANGNAQLHLTSLVL
jgi:DNA polymerase III delta prime subunit